MSEDTTNNTEGTEGDGGEDDAPMIDPSTGEPFPDTPEGRAAKKAFITARRDAKHPKGGPPGQQNRADATTDEGDEA